MVQGFSSEHWNDKDGNPAGGCSTGTGLCISWQNGPLGRGDDRKEPNGAFVEDVIGVAVDRLEFYQESSFACAQNEKAIMDLKYALQHLNARTTDREARQVEGTHSA